MTPVQSGFSQHLTDGRSRIFPLSSQMRWLLISPPRWAGQESQQNKFTDRLRSLHGGFRLHFNTLHNIFLWFSCKPWENLYTQEKHRRTGVKCTQRNGFMSKSHLMQGLLSQPLSYRPQTHKHGRLYCCSLVKMNEIGEERLNYNLHFHKGTEDIFKQKGWFLQRYHQGEEAFDWKLQKKHFWPVFQNQEQSLLS